MQFTRRRFLQTSAAASLALSTAPAFALGDTGKINRRAVVRRHNPVVTQFDPYASVSVGNGEFAFTADFTGLQTFAEACATDFPNCTMAHWAWHSTPGGTLRREDFKLKEYDTFGRKVGYGTSKTGQEPLFNALRQSPHGLHLGRIGLELLKPDGRAASPEDVQHARQELDLWSGVNESRFEFLGERVRVTTCAHPTLDALAVRVESPWLASGKVQVRLAFPYRAGIHHSQLERTRAPHERIDHARRTPRGHRAHAGRRWLRGETRVVAARAVDAAGGA
jgi:hypothetical protein